jgi:hypothetical protein
MGTLPAIEDMNVSSDLGVVASIKSARKTRKDHLLVVSLKLRDPTKYGYVTVTLAGCKELRSCPKKSVTFAFFFRDPNAVWVKDVSPLSTYVDGRVPVTVNIENLPPGLTTTDFIVTFFGNATIASVVYTVDQLPNGQFEVFLTVDSPVSEPVVLLPYIRIPRLDLNLSFPVVFTYLTAPSPEFFTIVPKKSKTTVSSPVRIEMRNFPGVANKADIHIHFL